MGIRENKVESELTKQIVGLGGITRKWVSPGVDGVPDRIVRLPFWPPGVMHLVEVKTEDGKVSPAQEREQMRLANQGCIVITLFGQRGVDRYIQLIMQELPFESGMELH